MSKLTSTLKHFSSQLPNFAAYSLQEPSLFWQCLKYAKKSYRSVNEINGKAQADQLKSRGVVQAQIAEEDVPLAKKMGKRFSNLIKSEKYYQPSDPNRANTKAFGKYIFSFKGDWRLYFPEIFYIVEHNLGGLLRSYFGKDYFIMSAEIRRTRYLPPDSPIKDAYSNFWHFDWRRNDHAWLLMTLHLNDHVHKESFHTFELDVSHEALRNKLHGRYPAQGLPEALKNKKYLTTGGPVGTCYLANVADLLHRAGDPGPEKDRDVIFVFLGSHVPWFNDIGFKNQTPYQIESDQSAHYSFAK